MNEEIKDIVEILELVKEELENNDENTSVILDLQDLKALKKLYDLYIEVEKERDGIYNDYQDIGKENLKLQEELEQEKNKINTIKQLMAVGDVTDEALFTLVQTTMAELDRLEDIEEKLDKEKCKAEALEKQHDYDMQMIDEVKGNAVKWANELEQEKEKNKSLKKQIKEMQEYYKNADFIFKDKIKEKIEEWDKSIKWANADDRYYAIKILKELLEEV